MRQGRLKMTLAAAALVAGSAYAQPSTPLPADEFAAGGAADCTWNSGGCNMLKAYLSSGGSDRNCLTPLRRAVQLEIDRNKLATETPQYGHDPAIEDEMAADDRERDQVLATVPPSCFTGVKGLYPEPSPPTPGPTPTPAPTPPPTPSPPVVTNSDFILTMTRCLSRLDYYKPMLPVTVTRTIPAADTSVEMRALAIATTMAADAVQQHDQLYGPSPSPTTAERAVVGFLDRCATEAGLLPAPTDFTYEPRAFYAQFLGVPMSDPQVEDFSRGYQQYPWIPTGLL